jgi:preprotein translocase SecF subunit
MYRLVERRHWYFLFSGVLILVGLVAMGYSWANNGSPVLLSVDFTGGSVFEMNFMTPREHIDVALAPYADDASPEVTALDDGSFEVAIDPDANMVLRSSVLAVLQQVDPDVAEDGDVFKVTPVATYNESTEEKLVEIFTAFELDEDLSIKSLGEVEEQRWLIDTAFVEDEDTQSAIIDQLESEIAPIDLETLSVARVSAKVGSEVTRAAIYAVFAVAVLILAFIFVAWFLRKVPHAFRYGACAIITMFHDVFITLGVMSVFGLLFGWRADALFLTAMLTVVGYSVQDTIVIYDRIRENLKRRRNEPFETIVNRSVLETIHRSLATQINAIFIMVAILLFGGETIRQFIVILLIGLATGTYSSIFTAAPLLVAWEKGQIPILSRLGRSS